jgi:hypothetical protein
MMMRLALQSRVEEGLQSSFDVAANIESSTAWRGRGILFVILLLNDVSDRMIATHLLNSNLNPFSGIGVINKDYKASNFGYACARFASFFNGYDVFFSNAYGILRSL